MLGNPVQLQKYAERAKKRTLLTETKKTKSKSMTEVCRIAKETHTSDKHERL